VLSLPPAFVLSQDQTLKFETLCSTLDIKMPSWSHCEFNGANHSDLSQGPALGLVKTQVLSVSFQPDRSPVRQDAAACVSLSHLTMSKSKIQTASQRGLPLNRDRNSTPHLSVSPALPSCPEGAVPGASAPQRRVPFGEATYTDLPQHCQRPHRKIRKKLAPIPVE
jgi:hypothetical protein